MIIRNGEIGKPLRRIKLVPMPKTAPVEEPSPEVVPEAVPVAEPVPA
jgi:hypothetical protein